MERKKVAEADRAFPKINIAQYIFAHVCQRGLINYKKANPC